MVPPVLSAARRRTVVVVDVLVVLWVVAWIVVGVLVGREVHRLRQLSDTLDTASMALHQTSDALDTVAKVPLVGGRIGEIADSIGITADQVQQNATDTRQSVDDLGYLLGVCIAVIPSVPVLAAYVPPRVRRARERRALQQALARSGERSRVERYLAHRAVIELTYEDLRRLSADPWRDVDEGRYGALAAAAYERVGVTDPWARR